MLRSCWFFSVICQQPHIDWEKHLPSIEYGVRIRRTVLGPDVLWCSWTRVPREWRRKLKMLRVMISKGYCLAMSDTVKEWSSFCGRLSFAMRRLYLRVFEKTIFSLHLSEWLEWKCRIVAQSFSVHCCREFAVCSNVDL